MKKPNLQSSTFHSTARTRNLFTNTYQKNTQIDRGFTERISSSYRNQLFFQKKEQPPKNFINPIQSIKQVQQQAPYFDTSDIQKIIKNRIEADSQLSRQNNFKMKTSQNYVLGPDIICSDNMIQIPKPVIQAIQNLKIQRNSEKIHLVYGYLRKINCLYYIVDTNLYIFNIQDLQNTSIQIKEKINSQKPIRIRQNCIQIFEIQYFNNKPIPEYKKSNYLLFHFPYEIQFCQYKFNKRQDQYVSQKMNKRVNISQITLISLNLRVGIQAGYAQFITSTFNGQLLYLNQNGLLNCFSIEQISGKSSSKIKSKIIKQGADRRKNFISGNLGLIKTAKNFFRKAINFCHSIYLSKKQNLCLVYDEKRNRIYTLTTVGDRTNIVQKMKKEIKVYDFYYDENKNRELKCLWSIQQEQLLAQINDRYISGIMEATIFSIQKVQAQYDRFIDLIVVLANGAKVLLNISPQKVKIVQLLVGPDHSKIQQTIKIQNENLINFSLNSSSLSDNQFIQNVSKTYEIKDSFSSRSKMKAFFSDRNLSINLIQRQKCFHMYVIQKQLHNIHSKQNYTIIPVNWGRRNFSTNQDLFPSQNKLVQMNNQNIIKPIPLKIIELQEQQKVNKYLKKGNFDINKIELINSHQYLRQVYCPPKKYSYISNKFVFNFTILRPIDILFFLINTYKSKTIKFWEKHLQIFLGNISLEQICCMLLQIYSDSEVVYFISQRCKKKINEIFHLMNQSSQRNKNQKQRYSNISSLSKKSQNERIQKQKRRFESFIEDKLQKIHSKKLSEETRDMVRRLFIALSKKQLEVDISIQKNQLFQEIDLQKSSTQSKQKNLNVMKQQKNVAYNCLIYVSRVFYPIWNCQLQILKVNIGYLTSIKAKVEEILCIVQLLKKQINQFYKQLHNFILKTKQIIEIFIQIPYLPLDLTLSQAFSQPHNFFQPYIFRSIRRELNPAVVNNKFKQLFSLFINKNFTILVRIYIEIELTSQISRIQNIIRSYPQYPYYPQYFVQYLLKEKRITDISLIKIKDLCSKESYTKIILPNLPPFNLLRHILNLVQNQQMQLGLRFQYLKEAKKILQSLRIKRQLEGYSHQSQSIQDLDFQYIQIYKILKLQQQYIRRLIKITDQQIKEKNQKNQKGLVQKIIQKISQSQQKSQQSQNISQISQLSNGYKYVNKQQIIKSEGYQYNRQSFDRLQNTFLKKAILEQLINLLDDPLLKISSLYVSIKKNQFQKVRQHKLKLIKQNYQLIVQRGMAKFEIEKEKQEKVQKKKLQDLYLYLKTEIKQLFIFLNSVKINMDFQYLYEGFKQKLIQYSYYREAMINRQHKDVFLIVKQLASFGFQINIISKYLLKNMSKIFIDQDIQFDENDPMQTQKWIFDSYMLLQLIKSQSKSSQQKKQLSQFHINIKELLQFKKVYLSNNEKVLKYLKEEEKTVFNILNNQENLNRGPLRV